MRRGAHFAAAAVAMAAPLCGSASAHEFKKGAIEIDHPWSRPTPPSAPVASGYVKLTNTGSERDRLLEVTSPIASGAEIHETAIVDGVARMRPVDGGVELPVGASIDFAASGLHVMFLDPVRMLKRDEVFPATLVFEKAGDVHVDFIVQLRPETVDGSAHGNDHGNQ